MSVTVDEQRGEWVPRVKGHEKTDACHGIDVNKNETKAGFNLLQLASSLELEPS